MDEVGAMDAAVLGMGAAVRHGAHWFVVAFAIATIAAIAAITAIAFIAPNHRVGAKEP